MRIAIVHSFYREDIPSGENQVVRQQVRALTQAGHSVRLVARYSDTQKDEPFYGLRSAFRVATGHGASPMDELRRFRPDITHVHNLFPNLGSAWLDEWTGPVVSTLHNFRTVCANGLLFRDGRYCEECPAGTSWAGFRHRCYRDSFVATLPLTIATARGVSGNRLVQRSDAVIVLSEAARDVFVSFGLDAARCHVIPNGVEVEPAFNSSAPEASPRAVVVGRLSAEKGILELVAQWPAGIRLDVIGDGPQFPEIKSIASTDVRIMGHQPHDAVMRMIEGASMLVVPSVCLEMQPTVVAEALGSGVPILALDGNGAADIVRAHGCGAVYSAASLGTAIQDVLAQGQALRNASLQTYRAHFAPSAWLEQLLSLYRVVTSSAGG